MVNQEKKGFSKGTILPHNTLHVSLRHERVKKKKKLILGQNLIKAIVKQCLGHWAAYLELLLISVSFLVALHVPAVWFPSPTL